MRANRAAGREQFGGSAVFGDAALGEDHHVVGAHDRAHAGGR